MSTAEPKHRYSREMLMILAESPLVRAPDGLPPIDSYFTKLEPKDTPRTKDTTTSSGGEDGPRNPTSSKPAAIKTGNAAEKGLVFGPPKMNFASSQQSPATSSPSESVRTTSTRQTRPPVSATTEEPGSAVSSTTRKGMPLTAGPSTSNTFPRMPKYSVEDRVPSKANGPSSNKEGHAPSARGSKEKNHDDEKPTTGRGGERRQPIPPPATTNENVAPRDLSVLRSKRSDEGSRARNGEPRSDGRGDGRSDRQRGPGGGVVNSNSGGSGDRQFIGTGVGGNSSGNTTTNNSVLRRQREQQQQQGHHHDGQPEWMSFDKGGGASKSTSSSSEEISKPEPSAAPVASGPASARVMGVGPDGMDEIQRFRQLMREKERVEREKAGLPPQPLPVPQSQKPVEDTLAQVKGPPDASASVDMMFGPGIMDSGRSIFDSSFSTPGVVFAEGGKVEPSGGAGATDPSDATSARRSGDPRSVSRFNKFFETTSSPQPIASGPVDVEGMDPTSRMQMWRETKKDSISPTSSSARVVAGGDATERQQQQMGMDLLAKIGVVPGGGGVGGGGDVDRRPVPPTTGFDGRKMPLEDEIMAQFMASKQQQQQHQQQVRPGNRRMMSEEEMIQNQILQQLSNPGGGGGGAMPAVPPGVRMMTEEDLLRMQRGRPPPPPPNSHMGGAPTMGMGPPPNGRIFSEEEVLMAMGGKGGMGRGGGGKVDRDVMGLGGNGAMEMNRVMAMLARSSLNNGGEIQGGPQNPNVMPPRMHPQMPPFAQMPPMGPQNQPPFPPHHLPDVRPTNPNFMFPPPPHLQNLPPHMLPGGPMPPQMMMQPPPPQMMQQQQHGMNQSLYRNAVNANLGGSDDQLAQLVQNSINAKKGGLGGEGAFFLQGGGGMMGRPGLMDGAGNQGIMNGFNGMPPQPPFFPQQPMMGNVGAAGPNPNGGGGQMPPPFGLQMGLGKANQFY
ncbi:hypothetical protein HDU67_010188 [Dinochytrium kinnereticum]|nr:hypothetical protein HDU67_010188 [Dinochytrium kinnereticum]